MTKEQHEALLDRIAPYMTRDQYGLHTICNLYFDTDNFDLVSRSIEKPVYKEKLRIRSYGIPDKDSQVFIELKKKYEGIVYKRRIETTLSKAEAFLSGQYQAVQDEQIAREIQYFLEFYHAYPRVYIAYDREAYFCEEDENLRMTFDQNIRSRDIDLLLESGDAGDSKAAEAATQVVATQETRIAYNDNDYDTTSDSVTATLKLNGDSIICDGSGVKVEGTTATISAAGTYVLEGKLTEGTIIIDADKKDVVHLILNGVEIHSESSVAIYVPQSEKCIITLAEGKDNSLSNGSYTVEEGADTPDAALYVQDDCTINGTGSLQIDGKCHNGISCKDNLKIMDGVITVSAVNNGNGNKYGKLRSDEWYGKWTWRRRSWKSSEWL